ncbi:hypothetical protein PIB30_006633 [Stylosanthes scabra]|uniref:Uncharacterized protein n=1 Tax=Stylosanthes scabra TaxID=79078 RepID=A0ABU6Q4D6_9FABA|nr:hypothetical protein [Stylosanthes scabra]
MGLQSCYAIAATTPGFCSATVGAGAHRLLKRTLTSPLFPLGSLEFVVPQADSSAFFPIAVCFMSTHTFSSLKLQSIFVENYTRQMKQIYWMKKVVLTLDLSNSMFFNGTDMHVYGQSPMIDLLQLVCCNFCKKPIKDSQYAIHAAQMQHWSRLTASTSPSDMASHHIRGRYSDSSCSNLLEFIPLDPCIPQTPLEFKYNLTLESQSTYEGPSALALPVHRVSPKYVLNSSSLE